MSLTAGWNLSFGLRNVIKKLQKEDQWMNDILVFMYHVCKISLALSYSPALLPTRVTLLENSQAIAP